MQVYRGLFLVAMAHQDLNGAEISTGLEQMSSEAMSVAICPKCQTAARDRWIEARRKGLLPTSYIHVVFTLPRPLAPVVLQNKKLTISARPQSRKPNNTLLRLKTHLLFGAVRSVVVAQ
jgi:hypothetical protein